MVDNFNKIRQAVSEMLEPARFREKLQANVAAIDNRAVFEIVDILEESRILNSAEANPRIAPAADCATCHLVIAARAGPMSLEAKPAVVFVCEQRGHLTLPIHMPRARRTPDRLVAFHMAILHVHMRNPILWGCRP